jgi:hypothetical protein
LVRRLTGTLLLCLLGQACTLGNACAPYDLRVDPGISPIPPDKETGLVYAAFDRAANVKPAPGRKQILASDCRLVAALDQLLARYAVVTIKSDSELQLGYVPDQPLAPEKWIYFIFEGGTNSAEVTNYLAHLPSVLEAFPGVNGAPASI